ncbi:MAG: tRNA (adenosine(37)-N6)-threonylcarbamoyltransferase complex dimerization subunit type 1 TsaB, partial [Alphaproteobacteria bacterium]
LNQCGAAVYASGKSVAETREMAQGHAEHLLPLVENALEKSGIAYADLDAIAVTVGPGSFTGLRVGLSAAKALALALNIPIFGITTTQSLALQSIKKKPDPVAVILETKRQDFYVQHFDGIGRAVSEAASLPGSDIKTEGFILIGDGVGRLTGSSPGLVMPDVGLIAELLATDSGFFTEGAEPVYLRGADVTASKQQSRTFCNFTE